MAPWAAAALRAGGRRGRRRPGADPRAGDEGAADQWRCCRRSGGPRMGAGRLDPAPPVPMSGKILCIGPNYAAHIAEMGRTGAAHPAVFTRWGYAGAARRRCDPREKARCSITRANLPSSSAAKGPADPGRTRLRAYRGLTVFNDASVRDWQNHASQFTPGKNFPGTAGCGPALVTADEVGDPTQLRVQTRANGELMQDQPVSDLIHLIPCAGSPFSSFTELGAPATSSPPAPPAGSGHGRKTAGLPPTATRSASRLATSAPSPTR